jgi:hypothetical protein
MDRRLPSDSMCYWNVPLQDTIRGRIQDFKLGGGGTLIKIAPSGGRLEKFWGISCEKSRFYAKKSYFSLTEQGNQDMTNAFLSKEMTYLIPQVGTKLCLVRRHIHEGWESRSIVKYLNIAGADPEGGAPGSYNSYDWSSIDQQDNHATIMIWKFPRQSY